MNFASYYTGMQTCHLLWILLIPSLSVLVESIILDNDNNADYILLDLSLKNDPDMTSNSFNWPYVSSKNIRKINNLDTGRNKIIQISKINSEHSVPKEMIDINEDVGKSSVIYSKDPNNMEIADVYKNQNAVLNYEDDINEIPKEYFRNPPQEPRTPWRVEKYSPFKMKETSLKTERRNSKKGRPKSFLLEVNVPFKKKLRKMNKKPVINVPKVDDSFSFDDELSIKAENKLLSNVILSQEEILSSPKLVVSAPRDTNDRNVNDNSISQEYQSIPLEEIDDTVSGFELDELPDGNVILREDPSDIFSPKGRSKYSHRTPLKIYDELGKGHDDNLLEKRDRDWQQQFKERISSHSSRLSDEVHNPFDGVQFGYEHPKKIMIFRKNPRELAMLGNKSKYPHQVYSSLDDNENLHHYRQKRIKGTDRRPAHYLSRPSDEADNRIKKLQFGYEQIFQPDPPEYFMSRDNSKVVYPEFTKNYNSLEDDEADLQNLRQNRQHHIRGRFHPRKSEISESGEDFSNILQTKEQPNGTEVIDQKFEQDHQLMNEKGIHKIKKSKERINFLSTILLHILGLSDKHKHLACGRGKTLRSPTVKESVSIIESEIISHSNLKENFETFPLTKNYEGKNPNNTSKSNGHDQKDKLNSLLPFPVVSKRTEADSNKEQPPKLNRQYFIETMFQLILRILSGKSKSQNGRKIVKRSISNKYSPFTWDDKDSKIFLNPNSIPVLKIDLKNNPLIHKYQKDYKMHFLPLSDPKVRNPTQISTKINHSPYDAAKDLSLDDEDPVEEDHEIAAKRVNNTNDVTSLPESTADLQNTLLKKQTLHRGDLVNNLFRYFLLSYLFRPWMPTMNRTLTMEKKNGSGSEPIKDLTSKRIVYSTITSNFDKIKAKDTKATNNSRSLLFFDKKKINPSPFYEDDNTARKADRLVDSPRFHLHGNNRRKITKEKLIENQYKFDTFLKRKFITPISEEVTRSPVLSHSRRPPNVKKEKMFKINRPGNLKQHGKRLFDDGKTNNSPKVNHAPVARKIPVKSIFSFEIYRNGPIQTAKTTSDAEALNRGRKTNVETKHPESTEKKSNRSPLDWWFFRPLCNFFRSLLSKNKAFVTNRNQNRDIRNVSGISLSTKYPNLGEGLPGSKDGIRKNHSDDRNIHSSSVILFWIVSHKNRTNNQTNNHFPNKGNDGILRAGKNGSSNHFKSVRSGDHKREYIKTWRANSQRNDLLPSMHHRARLSDNNGVLRLQPKAANFAKKTVSAAKKDIPEKRKLVDDNILNLDFSFLKKELKNKTKPKSMYIKANASSNRMNMDYIFELGSDEATGDPELRSGNFHFDNNNNI